MSTSSTAWTTWTCFCCGAPAPSDTPNRCDRCGGIYVRRIELTPWARVKHGIRRRFERTRTFESADELIAWLEDDR